MNKNFLLNLSIVQFIKKKIIKKITYFKNKKNFNKEFFEKTQNDLFLSIDLDRTEGLKKLKKFNQDFPLVNNVLSAEQDILFSSLSLKRNLENTEILEIGSYNGKNAFLLSWLFSNAKIYTIDLPKEDPDFKNTYSRKNNFNTFINDRDKILNQENIFFSETNSLNLINHKKMYDLIWVDGAHNNPTVTIDIINSIKLLKPNGLLICDDVITKDSFHKESVYSSIASLEVLESLNKEKIITMDFIYKKIDFESLCNPNNINYERKITVSKKIIDN
tara:strand:+ start:223 stop:1047 length:825 start_codon:yes stop_codon:yes gene_type:complete